MQFTSIVALISALAATSVQAAPTPAAAPVAVASLEERQALIAYIRFYGGNGCQEPWIEDTVFQQNDQCLNNSFAGPYNSFDIQTNAFTKTIRLYATTACGQGNYIDILPGRTGCFSGKINSYSFI